MRTWLTKIQWQKLKIKNLVSNAELWLAHTDLFLNSFYRELPETTGFVIIANVTRIEGY